MIRVTPQQARDAASAMRTGTKKARKEAAAVLKRWQAQQGKTRGPIRFRKH